jgi:hypothetical protein
MKLYARHNVSQVNQFLGGSGGENAPQVVVETSCSGSHIIRFADVFIHRMAGGFP